MLKKIKIYCHFNGNKLMLLRRLAERAIAIKQQKQMNELTIERLTVTDKMHHLLASITIAMASKRRDKRNNKTFTCN